MKVHNMGCSIHDPRHGLVPEFRGRDDCNENLPRDASDPPQTVLGLVKWYDYVKGYGFIVPEQGGREVLLRAKVLRAGGITRITEGTRIEVEIERTTRGDQATEVVWIEVMREPEVYAHDTDFLAKHEIELLPARVKWFSREQDYGFANTFGNSNDIFISGGVLRRSGIGSLEAGEAISVYANQSDRGLVALIVRPWR